MTSPYSAEWRHLSASALQAIGNAPAHDVQAAYDFANSLRSEPTGSSVSLVTAATTLAFIETKRSGFEMTRIRDSAVALGVGAILELGMSERNWYFDGAFKDSTEFFASFYTRPLDERRNFVRSLLGVTTMRSIAGIRITDSVGLTERRAEEPWPSYDKPPRLFIEAADLSARLSQAFGREAFIARAV